MKLPIHGHILYQVFKTYCSSIALCKYDFRTILWQSLQKTFNREGIYNATFSLQCINEDS
jgi:hypothetical protein